MKRAINVTVNGDRREVLVAPRDRLIDLLREGLGLLGTKEGCGDGNCGACTVLMGGKAVDSCLVLAMEADEREVVTIEGLAQDGHLHPLQQTFMDLGGLQCGICTPGFIVMAKALLDQNPRPTEKEIRFGIAGNLCRCTGYDKIVRAIVAAAEGQRA